MPDDHYHSDYGPSDGPIPLHQATHAIAVWDSPPNGPGKRPRRPVGVAFGGGWLPGRRGPIAVFRLVVGDVEVDGRFICEGQVFVRLGDAAEIERG